MIEIVARAIITDFNPAFASLKQVNSQMFNPGRPAMSWPGDPGGSLKETEGWLDPGKF